MVLSTDRWPAAPELLLDLIKRHCPEALPARYGEFEPLQHRFDLDHPEVWTEFVVENDDMVFWFASRPSFGGTSNGPRAAKYAKPDDEPYRIGHLEVSFDGAVVAEDARWREAVVELFGSVASATQAFYGAAQVETGWIVSRNNRIWADARTDTAEHFLRGRLWQGHPPIPVWLSWFGPPYRDLVADNIAALSSTDATTPARSGLGRFFKTRAKPPAVPVVATRGDGILVRLSDHALARSELPQFSLPPHLTYRHRPRTVDERGVVHHDPAQPEDRAEIIPTL